MLSTSSCLCGVAVTVTAALNVTFTENPPAPSPPHGGRAQYVPGFGTVGPCCCRTGDDAAVFACELDDVFGLDGRQHLRAVGGDDELRVRECPSHVVQDPLLPRRVEVQLDLIDQDDRFGRQRILEMRITLCHSPREICCERKHRALTIAQLVELKLVHAPSLRFHGHGETQRLDVDAGLRDPFKH